MPHIWIEYSNNLRPRLDVPQLMRTVQDSAIDDGSVFPLAGARTRAIAIEDYLIVDGHPDNTFIHVTIKIGHGRDAAEKQRAAERVFAALRAYTAPLMALLPLGLSLQLEEADPVLNLKHNNYRQYLQARQA
ncbi:5-carboxymethyl-2-hydroxymuconate Delta-isomerase [Bordetella sp. BOR01]|uniref:5-carboxymethyl-2-hydroxymuconate Delta-isomerase n=1 Tax=Bordetella sp. BOR01 TaxID=2854779 RepID=UPI001C457152|nr:5-carboxymethyl-2-hydroxymuconate Delta-isomerase [Bordetella sp. BOR01]MBV7485823.1 5-carboxymethyl-2-hydroxymuconate Delta-isomerase [Bordetella sp. BOR01]